ncbi:GMC oxidoreductase [Guyanagaster necrorhizus]|uniref:GMC oxidoreductase n=1 Tax=Guyanagaster necrorhizus TaxID=856835 RepID=A0A9P7VZJ6_9AGAR|nr:GMC oxidoreductase [Guyanagaster necrorhizus MCA 3950]KAG7449844.1 GMC oxidoreductase [Guyanagaster necrorhizus MCA 3950]
MLSVSLLALGLSFAASASCHLHAPLRTRAIIDASSLADSYDYIVVGGGSAGLVVASILSDNSSVSVLVLEAGQSGDDVAVRRDTPGMTYYNGLGGTSYDWSFSTATQTNLNDRILTWSRGKILGGSGATNGMYYTRPNTIEMNAWAGYLESQDSAGSAKWGWDNFYSVMKSMETWTKPTDAAESVGNIQYDSSVHGTSGPLHSSYPAVELGLVGNWTETCLAAGIQTRTDPHGGENWGAFVSTSSINPTNWTRSYSRSAYIDPLPPRSNLAILPSATVTKIVWGSSDSNGLKATGVSWAASSSSTEQTVNANKEVILAAGVVGSPHIMLLSGVGPSSVLSSVGIDQKLDLPGVGQNVQDHVGAGVSFATTADTLGSIYASNSTYSESTEFLSLINNAIAYVNLTVLMGSGADTWIQTVKNDYNTSTSYLPSTDSTIVSGYETTFKTITETYYASEDPQVEILLSLNSAGTVIIQAALQHPLSRGEITINSTSAFDSPVINPNYFAHWADRDILRAAYKLCRTIGGTAPLSNYLGTESSPGTNVDTDDEWNTWMNSNVHTDYHPIGSMSMLPKDQGGVVDTSLKVYGTSNVRVIDASVIPIEMSSHSGSISFAIGVQGAELIQNPVTSSTSTSSASSHSSSSTSSSGSSPSSSGSGAATLMLPPREAFGVAAIIAVTMLFL